MYKLKMFLLVFILFYTNVIGQDSKFSAKKVGHVYNISFPEYMTRSYGLNNASKAQYMNAEREAYTIVIDDEKEEIKLVGVELDSLSQYYDFFMEGFKIDSSEITSKINLKINKLNAIQIEVIGSVEGARVFYLITFIETKNYYYNIISWTLYEHKDELIKDYKKIASSFKE